MPDKEKFENEETMCKLLNQPSISEVLEELRSRLDRIETRITLLETKISNLESKNNFISSGTYRWYDYTVTSTDSYNDYETVASSF